MGKLHLVVVTNLTTNRTVDENVQIEAFVCKGVVETKGVLGQWVANDGTVVLVDDAVTVQVLVLDISNPNGRAFRKDTIRRIGCRLRRCFDVLQTFVDTVANVAVEVVQRLTLLGI